MLRLIDNGWSYAAILLALLILAVIASAFLSDAWTYDFSGRGCGHSPTCFIEG